VRDSADRFDLVAHDSILDDKLELIDSIPITSTLPAFLQEYGRTLLRDDLGSAVRGHDAELAIEQLAALGAECVIR
jgi:hypothetical protein